MKCLMVMFDSLNRHHLPNYGCQWTHAPNFRRLGERAATFDTSYVCSMPCMPARRDLHTGRPNFLHRSWGPLEPFDDSVFEMLKGSGVHCHLSTDHYHYFEDGGGTYHPRYSTWDFHRGQEGDPWRGRVDGGDRDEHRPLPGAIARNAARDQWTRQDRVNRSFMRAEHEMPQARTFAAGLDFVRRNADRDNWLCHIETFDPHEPFVSHRKYKDRFAEHYDRYKAAGGAAFDWPWYRGTEQVRSPEQLEHLRYEYASLLAMCDCYMGDVLDTMDELDLWRDTMLAVWTDHGFLLGEHDCLAKIWMPFYEEVAHTPFFMYDPRSPGCAGQRRRALVQPSIDLGPTLLEFFGRQPTKDMLGKPLRGAVADDTPVREAAMFGVHGSQVNVTDGRHVYMRAPASPDGQPLFNYTHMPTHMRHPFPVEQLQDIRLAEPFGFTKGCRTMKIRGHKWGMDEHPDRSRTLLYDVGADPRQERAITDPAVERRMIGHLDRLMRECEAPPEQWERLGLSR